MPADREPIRSDLVRAYETVFGRIPAFVQAITFIPEEIEKYRVHGKASIDIPFNSSPIKLVDMKPLLDKADSFPKFAYLKSFTRGCVEVVVTSGKQDPKNYANPLDPDRTLEGLYVSFDLSRIGRGRSVMRDMVNIHPVYQPQ